jgi:hypothetical protein
MTKRIQYSKLKFREQPIGSGACGKYSIQNALLFLGITITQDTLDRLTKTSKEWTARFGTDSYQIKAALKALNLFPRIYHRTDPAVAKHLMDKLLKKSPLILSTMLGQHWVAIGKKSGNYYIMVDADRKPLLQKRTWNQLLKEIGNEKDFYFIRVTK